MKRVHCLAGGDLASAPLPLAPIARAHLGSPSSTTGRCAPHCAPSWRAPLHTPTWSPTRARQPAAASPLPTATKGRAPSYWGRIRWYPAARRPVFWPHRIASNRLAAPLCATPRRTSQSHATPRRDATLHDTSPKVPIPVAVATRRRPIPRYAAPCRAVPRHASQLCKGLCVAYCHYPGSALLAGEQAGHV